MASGTITKIREALAREGLYPEELIIDGKIHRFSTNGRRGDKAGYYCFWDHGDGFVAGFFGDWRSGLYRTWHSKQGKKLTSAEAQKVKRQIAQAKEEAEKERQKAAERAAKKAQRLLARAKPANPEHAYLKTKKIDPVGSIRQIGKNLIIPVADTQNRIYGAQFIAPDGLKWYIRGTAKSGHFFRIGGDESRIFIVEGYATGASVFKATGSMVFVAFDAGNLIRVAKTVRERYPEAEIIITADNDRWTPGNPGLTKATEAAHAIGAKLAIPTFKDTTTKPTDFNDLYVLEGLEAVKRRLKAAKRPETKNTLDQALDILSHLDAMQYEQQRKELAERFKVRVGFLDKLFAAAKKEENSDADLIFDKIEPWPEPVDGITLLDQIKDVVGRHVVMESHFKVATTLWIVLTYCYDCFRILPILGITSPEKRCGKTTLLECLHALVDSPLLASNISPAAIYRVIEKCKPCLLIDEADTFVRDNDELRGVINSGHTRKSAFVIRVNGETLEPEKFSTWCPKAIALIGSLPSTLEDRSIKIKLHRKTNQEKVTKIGLNFDEEQTKLRRKIKRWVQDHLERLRAEEPEIPENGNDRASDNWSPLFALANVAGGEWPEKAKAAFLRIESDREDRESIKQKLLRDIRYIFDEHRTERIFSKDLVQELVSIEDAPWCEWRKGKPISQVSLARLLEPFGIRPKTLRIGSEKLKGYQVSQFQEAFKRYVSPPPPQLKRDTVTSEYSCESREKSKRDRKNDVTFQIPRKSASDNDCHGVTDETPSPLGRDGKKIEFFRANERRKLDPRHTAKGPVVTLAGDFEIEPEEE